jgi:hypothetical protein
MNRGRSRPRWPEWPAFVALLFSFVVSAGAWAPVKAPEDTKKAPLGGDAVIRNATDSTIEYRAWKKGARKQSRVYRLDSGDYHLWRESQDLIVAHGEALVETPIRKGAIYEFRAGRGKAAVSLVRLVLRPESPEPKPARGPDSGKLEEERLRKEVARLRTRIGDLEADLARRARAVTEPTETHRVGEPAAARPNRPLKRLSKDGDVLTVVTWPAGAHAWLVDTRSKGPLRWIDLGATPVESRVKPGAYLLILVRQRIGKGHWASPTSRSGVLDAGPEAPSWLTTGVTKVKDVPALARAVWVGPDGPMPERLVRATADGHDLFDLPPFEVFRVFCTRALARTGVALTNEQSKALYNVMRKCGWLRYELADVGVGVDLEFHPGQREPFRSRAVRLVK